MDFDAVALENTGLQVGSVFFSYISSKEKQILYPASIKVLRFLCTFAK